MVRVIEEAVKNKTVTEVVVDARNATVELAERVSESEAVQGAKVGVGGRPGRQGRCQEVQDAERGIRGCPGCQGKSRRPSRAPV